MRWHKALIPSAIALSFIIGIFAQAGESESAFLIKGAKIYTSGPLGVLTDADLFIENGRFQRIIQDGERPSVPVKDYSGKIIIPGMVDAHSFVSAYTPLLENTEVITSDLVTEAVFDPLNPEIDLALGSGITTVNLVPRNENLVGGMSSILKISRDFASIPVLKNRAFLKISFNGEVIRSDRAPTSLMGAEKWLSQKMRAIKAEPDSVRENIFQQNGLRSLLKGDILPMIAASNEEEINTALAWLEDWNLQGVIVGGEEACLLIDRIEKNNVPVLLSSILPSYPGKWAQNAACLLEKGLLVGFVSCMPESGPLGLRFSALMLCHQGISQQEALKTITSHPAQILGVADSVGSIEEGKHADFVVFDGEPLDLRSRVVAVFVNGHALVEGEIDP